MQQIEINANEAGQRFDKFLMKYFKEAGSGFIYKMLRKKNITLNGKKSDGKDKLNQGDVVKIFMADETIAKFRGLFTVELADYIPLDVVYEDDNVLIINKPSGMLSQKAKDTDVSANEYIISYLVHEGVLSMEELATFKPSICNRLDRNTSGLLVAGKSLLGLQVLSEMFKNRTMDKYYLAVVAGSVTESMKISGYLNKDEKTNKVTVSQIPEDGKKIETEYEPLKRMNQITLLKVKLITGKPHQIRAHLASVGHPIIGDYKYGMLNINQQYKEQFGITDQMLHAWKLCFGVMPEGFKNLEKKEIVAALPDTFVKVCGDEIKD